MKKSVFFLCWIIGQVHLAAEAKQSLFLIAGQSNGAGKGDATLAPVISEGMAYEYVFSQQRLSPLMDPVGVNELTFEAAASGSAWPAFAKRYYELTGDTVILVAAARGGSSCHPLAELANYGTWSTNGKLFGNAVMKTKTAMRQTRLPLSGIIWVQGERDANAINKGQINQRDYRESLRDLILRFRLAFGDGIPVFISKTGFYEGHEQVGFKQVQAAQEEIVNTIDDVVMAFDGAPTFLDSGKMTDAIHYNQTGLNEMGACIAEKVFAYRGVNAASFYPLPVLKKGAIEEFSFAQKELKTAYLGRSMTSNKAGASFTVAFEGDAIGLFDVGGPEVGQLKILLDGNALKWEQTQGVRYQLSNRGASSINRYNVNCNNRSRGQFFILQLSVGVRVVEFKIDDGIPDKRKILGSTQIKI